MAEPSILAFLRFGHLRESNRHSWPRFFEFLWTVSVLSFPFLSLPVMGTLQAVFFFPGPCKGRVKRASCRLTARCTRPAGNGACVGCAVKGRIRGREGLGGIAVGAIQELGHAAGRVERPLVVRRSRRAWERSYVAAVVALDASAALTALVIANVRYGGHPLAGQPLWQQVAFTTTLVSLWLTAMAAARSYEPRFLGLGSEEYRRILVAAVAVMATVATVSWATQRNRRAWLRDHGPPPGLGPDSPGPLRRAKVRPSSAPHRLLHERRRPCRPWALCRRSSSNR